MHIILGLLATAAAIIYYLTQISKGAGHVVDAANELSNMPRKLRYRNKAGKRGLDLVETPVEAATVLMISIARLDKLGRVSDEQARTIANELVDHMQLDRSYADDLIINMRSLSRYLTQPESTLFPMVSVLQGAISKEDALGLAEMMTRVANVDGHINSGQEDVIRRFKDRMGLLG